MLHPRSTRRILLVLPLAVVGAAVPEGPAAGGTPGLEITNLFEGGTGGFTAYRIPGIVVTPRGTVLAYCEARKHSAADWGEIEVHLRRSTDGGVTFGPPHHVAHLGPRLPRNPVTADQPAGRAAGRPGEQTVNNPVAIVSRTGTVHLLYCVEYMRCFSIRSADDGITWSAPREITAAFEPFRRTVPWKVIATGPGHGIELTNGRLVVPVWIATSEGHPHGGGTAATIVSDDGGESWRPGAIVTAGDGSFPELTESNVAELGDGRVMFVGRNHGPPNRKLVAFSPDGSGDWTRPAYAETLLEPICASGLLTLPALPGTNAARVLFSNPASLVRMDGDERPGARRDRLAMTVRLSLDDGCTWPISRTIEPGPSGYSDLATLPDGTILCLFERGRGMPTKAGEKVFPYAFISLARFSLAWLQGDGDDPITTSGDGARVEWRRLPPLPDPLGVAGPFVGSHRGALIVAGGANFPVAEGQDRWQVPKVWHDDAWVLAPAADGRLEWCAQAPLPRPIGYGSAATTPAGVVCSGGEDGTSAFDTVMLLSWDPDARRLVSRPLPALPQPTAFGGAASIGSVVYVACGQSAVGPVAPTAAVQRLDLGDVVPSGDDPATLHWESLPPVPGGPRTHAIVVTRDTDTGGRLCVLSGRRPDPRGAMGAIDVLRDAWEFDPDAWEAAGRPASGEPGWRRLADLPAPRMAGVAIPVSSHVLAVLSGDDGRLFTKVDLLRDSHPGFPVQSLFYDAARDRWQTGGMVPAAQVTTSAVPWAGGYAIVSGEVRPRLRTPDAWAVVPASTDAASARGRAPK